MSETERKVRAEFNIHVGFAAAFSVILFTAIRAATAGAVGTGVAWTVHGFTGSELADDIGWGTAGITLAVLLIIPRLMRAISDHREVIQRTGRIIRRRYD